MKKYLAELIGTFTLVLFGCGTAVIAGPQVGFLGISFAFGLALIAMAYGIGPISGCHINPAVSLGLFAAGKMSAKDLAGYIVGQLIGALLAALVIAVLTSQMSNLGQNGWGIGYLGSFGLIPAVVFELVATFLFVVVILGSTQDGAPTQLAGLAIGLTLVVIHILGINITGVSVNPARSFGPALLVGGNALSQLWLFLVIPSVGGLLAGLLFRFKVLTAK